MANSLTLLQESKEIPMRCLNFFWTKVADILYHRGGYRNFHVIRTSPGQVLRRPSSFATSNLAFTDV